MGGQSGLFELPNEIFTNILASFCDGKAFSTFLMASQASHDFDAFDTVQGALIQRYHELSEEIKDPNIIETLQILISKIQFFERSDPQCTRLFSERCAILDYFEAHQHLYEQQQQQQQQHKQKPNKQQHYSGHWLIWCGTFQSFFGPIHAHLLSPYWSISAIAGWYRDFELTALSIVRPRVSTVPQPSNYPFGSLIGNQSRDQEMINLIRVKLEDHYHNEHDFYRGILTALQYAYEDQPPLLFSTHTYPILVGHETAHMPTWIEQQQSLCCYWDDSEGYDDAALEHLGEHVILLMNNFVEQQHRGNDTATSFREAYRYAQQRGYHEDTCCCEESEEEEEEEQEA